MGKVFEDEFMDIQSQIISLCLELVGSEVSKVYAYGSIEERSISFNAFFDIGGEIKTINNFASNTEAIWEFLALGVSELGKIKELCKKYNRATPTELKMIHDCNGGKFDSQYKYESICSAKTGIDSSRVFMNWINEIQQCS